eukprot:TRINITY_DN30807_c0_g1_i3.p5 TRINITY_DN30807_c0_g1~~TRINITY_DN30807_c0_g1_i3.p5  ORF type:complete len:106 (-),score=5.67 TRINITY_DN30807_c0_g1_i3:931-1248(-)
MSRNQQGKDLVSSESMGIVQKRFINKNYAHPMLKHQGNVSIWPFSNFFPQNKSPLMPSGVILSKYLTEIYLETFTGTGKQKNPDQFTKYHDKSSTRTGNKKKFYF